MLCDTPKIVGDAGLVELEVSTDKSGGRMDVFDIEVDEVATEISKSSSSDVSFDPENCRNYLHATAATVEDAEFSRLEDAVVEARKNGCSHSVQAAERRLQKARDRAISEQKQRDRARAEADAEVCTSFVFSLLAQHVYRL